MRSAIDRPKLRWRSPRASAGVAPAGEALTRPVSPSVDGVGLTRITHQAIQTFAALLLFVTGAALMFTAWFLPLGLPPARWRSP